MKEYEVEIYSKYQNGRYGCTHYFGMVLSHKSKAAAVEFAKEIVSCMTLKEFNGMCIHANLAPFEDWIYLDLNKKVGDMASSKFKYKARVANV